MEEKNISEDKIGSYYSNLNFITPRNFIQIYFNIEKHTAHTVEVSSSSSPPPAPPPIKGDWRDPKVYLNSNEKHHALFSHDHDLQIPSCIWPSSDASTASSSGSDDAISMDVWDIAVQERIKLQRECSAAVYFPFRCMNDFEFFTPSVTCLDVDDNPALPLFQLDVDVTMCWSFRKRLWCIFPFFPKKPQSTNVSSNEEWKRNFYTYR